MCWSKSLRAAPVACIGPICGEGAAGAGATRVVRAGIPAISKILAPGLAASARSIAASERVLVLLSEGVQGLFTASFILASAASVGEALGALEKGVPGDLQSTLTIPPGETPLKVPILPCP